MEGLERPSGYPRPQVIGDRITAPGLQTPEFEGAEVCHCKSLAAVFLSAQALFLGVPSGRHRSRLSFVWSCNATCSKSVESSPVRSCTDMCRSYSPCCESTVHSAALTWHLFSIIMHYRKDPRPPRSLRRLLWRGLPVAELCSASSLSPLPITSHLPSARKYRAQQPLLQVTQPVCGLSQT